MVSARDIQREEGARKKENMLLLKRRIAKFMYLRPPARLRNRTGEGYLELCFIDQFDDSVDVT